MVVYIGMFNIGIKLVCAMAICLHHMFAGHLKGTLLLP